MLWRLIRQVRLAIKSLLVKRGEFWLRQIGETCFGGLGRSY